MEEHSFVIGKCSEHTLTCAHYEERSFVIGKCSEHTLTCANLEEHSVVLAKCSEHAVTCTFIFYIFRDLTRGLLGMTIILLSPEAN